MSSGSDAEEVTNITHVKKSKGNGSAAKLLAALKGSGEDAKVQPEVREAFLLLDRMFSDRLSEVEAEYESRLRAERQKRRDAEKEEEFRRREEQNAKLQKIKDEKERELQVDKSIRLNRIGWAVCSLMILGLGGDRFWRELKEQSQLTEMHNEIESIETNSSRDIKSLEDKIDLQWLAVSNTVAQLDRQVVDYRKLIEADEFEENEKYATWLKMADALKSQVAEMQWYVNDDTREIMSDLRDFVNQQKAKESNGDKNE